MKSWKRRFKDYILERGRDYYEAGLVGEVCRSNYGYEAEVEGSELYHVEIDVSNDVIQDMYCSCPYAEGGNNCKHMAAVLYKFENEGELEDVCSKEEWKSYLDVVLKHLKTTNLKLDFLNHEKLYEDMMDLILDSKDVMYMDQYESVLKGLFPERVLEFYIHFLKQEVEFVRNRKEYCTLMIYLQKISSIEGGYVEACRLANEWRHVYFRRRAMMDELEQAGF